MTINQSIPYDDQFLDVKISPIHQDHLIVKEFAYYEGLSESAELTIIVYPKDIKKQVIDLIKWRMQDVTVTWTTPDKKKNVFTGKIDQVSCMGQDMGTIFYKIIARPQLTLLRGKHFKIYQKENTSLKLKDDVIKPILDKYHLAFSEQNINFQDLDMIIQYDESDWELIQRYLSYEGVFYYWDRKNHSKWTLDHKAPSETPVELQYRVMGGIQSLGVIAFNPSSHLGIKKHTVKDYNYDQTSLNQFGFHDQKETDSLNQDDTVYFPGYSAQSDVAQIRAENWALGQNVDHSFVVGVSNYPDLHPLLTFKIKDYPFLNSDKKDSDVYYITGINHYYVQVPIENTAISLNVECPPDNQGDVLTYWNTFKAVPKATVFKPQLIKKSAPMILSGRAFTKDGKEIDIDQKGRILVKFPWDDEQSTCRIRFMQPWAGHGFGVTFIPRVGMEVMVGFENNDLNRPIVLGCVHNAMNPMNDQIAKEGGSNTTSLIRTQSSQDSNNPKGFNELSFDDKVGEERFYTHAQKDAIHVVEKNSVTHVLNESYEVNVWGGTEKKCDAASKEIDSKGKVVLRLHVPKGDQVTDVGEGNQKHTVTRGDIVITNKEGKITIIDENGNITIDAKSGNIDIKSSTKITLQAPQVVIKGDEKVEIEGGMVDIKGTQQVNVKGPQVSINADVQLEGKGGLVNMEASGIMTIKGSLINNN